MNRIFFFFSFLIFSTGMMAQVTMLPASNLFSDYSNQIRTTINKKLSNIEGSPYVFEEFLQGIVYPKLKNEGFRVELNVNAYSNLFEIQFDDAVYEMSNYSFDSVSVQNHTFIPVSVIQNDILSYYSMEVLAGDGKGNYLVKQHVVQLLDATIAKAYHQATPPRYQVYPSNYFIYDLEKRTLYPMRMLKRLTKNPDMPSDLKIFLKENKIRTRNIDDLKKLFHFLYP